MTNVLVGEVYIKIIEEVIHASTTDFEESGVSQTTLQEMRQDWQAKLSARGVAHMPWEPKPQPAAAAPPPAPSTSVPSAASNGLPSASYANYDTPSSNAASSTTRIKTEPGADSQYNGLPNGYSAETGPPQGGLARATHLIQQQYGNNATASLNAAQRGLALPGQQQQQQQKPQGLHLPGQASPTSPPQYSPQQQQAAMQQRQQLQQQNGQPRIKVENESPQLPQGGFPQAAPQPNYSQTDGADEDGAHEQWRELLAQRRAVNAEHREQADRLVRESVLQGSFDLTNGLMVPLVEQPSMKRRQKRRLQNVSSSSATPSASTSQHPSIPQLDGEMDNEDEKKPDIKDEDDENAINSDLDDSDDNGQGPMGDDDDEQGDQILCTYDKVQRVKNKWKCVLKDGVLSVGGKDWVFHKGNGEFEW